MQIVAPASNSYADQDWTTLNTGYSSYQTTARTSIEVDSQNESKMKDQTDIHPAFRYDPRSSCNHMLDHAASMEAPDNYTKTRDFQPVLDTRGSAAYDNIVASWGAEDAVDEEDTQTKSPIHDHHVGKYQHTTAQSQGSLRQAERGEYRPSLELEDAANRVLRPRTSSNLSGMILDARSPLGSNPIYKEPKSAGPAPSSPLPSLPESTQPSRSPIPEGYYLRACQNEDYHADVPGNRHSRGRSRIRRNDLWITPASQFNDTPDQIDSVRHDMIQTAHDKDATSTPIETQTTAGGTLESSSMLSDQESSPVGDQPISRTSSLTGSNGSLRPSFSLKERSDRIRERKLRDRFRDRTESKTIAEQSHKVQRLASIRGVSSRTIVEEAENVRTQASEDQITDHDSKPLHPTQVLRMSRIWTNININPSRLTQDLDDVQSPNAIEKEKSMLTNIDPFNSSHLHRVGEHSPHKGTDSDRERTSSKTLTVEDGEFDEKNDNIAAFMEGHTKLRSSASNQANLERGKSRAALLSPPLQKQQPQQQARMTQPLRTYLAESPHWDANEDEFGRSSSTADQPSVRVRDSRLFDRLARLEQENQLLEAALLAMLKTAGRMNRCSCDQATRDCRSNQNSTNGSQDNRDSFGRDSSQRNSNNSMSNASGASALELYMRTRNGGTASFRAV